MRLDASRLDALFGVQVPTYMWRTMVPIEDVYKHSSCLLSRASISICVHGSLYLAHLSKKLPIPRVYSSVVYLLLPLAVALVLSPSDTVFRRSAWLRATAQPMNPQGLARLHRISSSPCWT